MKKFNYKKIGSGNNKIIFVHGFGASHKTFYDLLPFFDESYEIYLIDLIGFGDSQFDDGWEYTIENQAELLYAFLKEHRLFGITLVGHSYGGGVTLLLLNMLRKRGEQEIINNAILIGSASIPQKIPYFIQFPAKHPLLYKIFMVLIPKKVLARLMLKYLYFRKELINDEKIERYSSYFRKTHNINGIIHTAQNVVPRNIDDIVEQIKFITTKTLILWGDKDFVIEKKSILRLRDEIVNSKLVIVENVGHVVQEEVPELVFNEISKFINSNVNSTS